MKENTADIPKYNLKNFREVHRETDAIASFGNNQLEKSNSIDGFELYSSEGIKSSAGPLKSEFYRISITVTGSLDMQIGLERYAHQPRTLAFTFPNQIFSKSNISKDASGYYMLFSADFLSDLIPSMKIADEFPFYDIDGIPVFQISDEELDQILSLVMHINDELQHQQSGREKAIKMYLYLLLLEVKRCYERQFSTHTDKAISEDYKLANRFRKLVPQHFLTKRQVNDYAQMLGVSANHLNKTVKESTGQTASDAIREMLLQEAKSLLRYTDISVAEIAYKMDYSEPASFNRFFKSMTKETPLTFRGKHN